MNPIESPLSPGPSGDAPLEAQLARRKLVVVIGIDEYRGLPKLRCAVKDALGVQDLLVRHFGFEAPIPPLTNQAATKAAIEALVEDQLRKLLGEDDALILFFAGHGTTRLSRLQEVTIETGYIAPVEARGPDHFSELINMEELLRRIGILPAQHILVVLDACHSGMALGSAMSQTRSAEGAYVHRLVNNRSRRVITSARRQETALDNGPVPGHSLFTGALIQALTSGRADIDGNGIVTFSELGLHLQQWVGQASGSRQTPDFGAFHLDDRGELLLPIRPGARWQPPALPTPRRGGLAWVGAAVAGGALLVAGIAAAAYWLGGSSPSPEAPSLGAPPGWTELTSPSGGFKVQVPGAPITTKTAVSARDGFVGFNIRWRDRPSTDTTAVQEIIDAARDRRIANGCTLVSERWLAAGRYPARDLVFECSQKKSYERIIVARQRTYTLVVDEHHQTDAADAAQRFFDSFEITL